MTEDTSFLAAEAGNIKTKRFLSILPISIFQHFLTLLTYFDASEPIFLIIYFLTAHCKFQNAMRLATQF